MPNRRKKRKSPKRVLRLPDLALAKAVVLNTLTSVSAQRSYEHAITEFVDWYCSEPRLALNRVVVLRYRMHLEQLQYTRAASTGVARFWIQVDVARRWGTRIRPCQLRLRLYGVEGPFL